MGVSTGTPTLRVHAVVTNRTPIGHLQAEFERIYQLISDALSGAVGVDDIAPSSGPVLFNMRSPNAQSTLQLNSFNTTPVAGSRVLFIRGRGTDSSRVAVQPGDSLMLLEVVGIDSTGSTGDGGSIRIEAAENWTPTSRGTSWKVNLVPVGASTSQTIITATTSSVVSDAPIVDVNKTLYIPAVSFSVVSGAGVRAAVGDVNVLRMSAGVNTAASAWVAMPSGWAGRAVTQEVYYRGRTGSNDYRVLATIDDKDPGDDFAVAGTISNFSLNVGGTADVVVSATQAQTRTLSSEQLLCSRIERLGTNPLDTEATALDFLGVRFSLA